MGISVSPFGCYDDGSRAHLITLESNGAFACFTEFGASLVSLAVPDRQGRLTDVVLGLSSGGEYERHSGCLGAVCGRFANRISGSSFRLNEEEYRLDPNHQYYTLHGGSKGFHRRIWEFSPEGGDAAFSLFSPDGDMGFPGNLRVTVKYHFEFAKKPILLISYSARCDRDTVISLTNHSYFNLSGHASGDMHQRLYVNADFFNPQDERQLPTGEVLRTRGTALDFSTSRDVYPVARSGWEQIRFAGGLDHNFLLKSDRRGSLTLGGRLYSTRTGISMEALTTLPAMMVYTANFLNIPRGKEGVAYGPNQAVCLECQNVPDSPNFPHFPSPVLKADEDYYATTAYVFSAGEGE